MMNDTVQNSISTKDLCKEYEWYENTFPMLVQESCDEFFEKNFEIKFVGLSKNINCLIDNESIFVTKIKINPEYDMFFRLTDKSVSIILNKILGQSKNKFNINKISELEAKIITTFNSYIFDAIKTKLNEPAATELKRSNFDIVHLTFILKDTDEFNKAAGKFILSLPLALLSPTIIESSVPKFSDESFPNSETFVKVVVGSTKFSLFDLKNLEQEDVVVFEDSNIKHLKLSVYDKEMDVNISPNMDLLIPEANDGGEDMGATHGNNNIWDSIEVDMYAEFDAVKITLGELKDIENGLVVDLTSLYDNNVTLKVEGKPIASGSLVIVNDRYGVKINEVLASGASGSSVSKAGANPDEDDYSEDEEEYNEESDEQEEYSDNEENEDEEFDYSDFELEDENI
ncbi:FliM/FliN family flagellar motor switch protein [bacterium]|nr:FliM/FliN family flagellar motor switch protein [bacterium]